VLKDGCKFYYQCFECTCIYSYELSFFRERIEQNVSIHDAHARQTFADKREGPLRRYSRSVIQAQHPDSDEIHPTSLKEEEIEDLFGRSSS
jgi:hypothetical protein